MPEASRLNGVIGALERGDPAFVAFSPAEIGSAQAFADAPFDGIVFEMEHGPYDTRTLRDCLQYMLNRRQIVDSQSLAPAVTPMVRIPPNGGEHNQWVAKQVLDIGVYGVVWPHVSTVEDAHNAVAACRYPRPTVGRTLRASRPARRRADRRRALLGRRPAGVLPRAPTRGRSRPDGEILVVIMAEEARAIDNLPRHPAPGPGHRRRADRRR